MGQDDPSRIVLAMHATQALNIAIFGLDLKTGQRVITTVTEHNSVLRPLNHLCHEKGIEIEHIGLDASGALDIGAYEKALAKEPALVAINHASNVTGRISDAGRLLAQAKEAGAVTLLDASQSLGHIPVEPEKLGADLVAFTGHKGLRGPLGTGGLYVAPHIELKRTYVGGTGIRSDLELHPPEMPIRHEAGSPNIPAFAGLAAALRWHESAGAVFQQKEDSLADMLRSRLREIPGVRIFDDDPAAERTAVVSFIIDGWDIEDAGFILQESYSIVCRTGLHCAPLIHRSIGSAPAGTIRFSLSGFNTGDEVDYAAEAVKKIANGN